MIGDDGQMMKYTFNEGSRTVSIYSSDNIPWEYLSMKSFGSSSSFIFFSSSRIVLEDMLTYKFINLKDIHSGQRYISTWRGDPTFVYV